MNATDSREGHYTVHTPRAHFLKHGRKFSRGKSEGGLKIEALHHLHSVFFTPWQHEQLSACRNVA